MGLFSIRKNIMGVFRELGDWNDYALLNAYGIVNPYGPTLMAVIVKKPSSYEKLVPVYLLQIHPFQPRIVNKWVISLDSENYDDDITIRNVISDVTGGKFSMNSCPTLLVEGTVHRHSINAAIFRLIVRRSSDGVKTLNRCRKFLGNPFDRVTSEMDEALSSLESMLSKSKENDDIPKDEYCCMTEEEAEEFVDMQLKYASKELKAFNTAFNGAIVHVPHAKAKMSYKELQYFLVSMT